MHYFSEIFIGYLTIFVFLEAFLIGVFISTSIYFFTKNKWGSILLCVPFSAAYLFIIYEYPFHLIFMLFELIMQYAIIQLISNLTKKQSHQNI